MRAALQGDARRASTVTSPAATPLEERRSGGGTGPSVLTEALIGGVGALVILFFVFGTLPAVAMPLAIAIASILNTFTLVWRLTYVTERVDHRRSS